MTAGIEKRVFKELKGIREANATVERLVEAATPSSAFAAPLPVGDYTLITAAETSCWLGLGYGVGAGQPAPEDEPPEAAAEGYGGGGGGGGWATARPVAAIVVGPEGVSVQPIRDVTKVLLALATALGGMALMLGRMSRASRR